MFLAAGAAADGNEQFERTLAVPFRLQRIEAQLGDAARYAGRQTIVGAS